MSNKKGELPKNVIDALRAITEHGLSVKIHDGKKWAGGLTRDPHQAAKLTGKTSSETIYVYATKSALPRLGPEFRDEFTRRKMQKPGLNGMAIGLILLSKNNDGKSPVLKWATPSLTPFLSKNKTGKK
ncbi:hypothetical protein [Aeromonas veronii]|uniref:hypothetical protein n=1 Tax=Aeromonas veronii TaxID=654 RepID=UPI0011B22B28|nr:hypothetical protein [Aeromonas veronii]